MIEERDLLRQQLEKAKRMLAEQIDSDVEELIRRGNRDMPDQRRRIRDRSEDS